MREEGTQEDAIYRAPIEMASLPFRPPRVRHPGEKAVDYFLESKSLTARRWGCEPTLIIVRRESVRVRITARSPEPSLTTRSMAGDAPGSVGSKRMAKGEATTLMGRPMMRRS